MPLVDGKKRNVFALAANGSTEEGVIQVVDSKRLAELSETNEGGLSYRLAFLQNEINAARGVCEVSVNVELAVKQTCQRCLALADITAQGESVVAVVRKESQVEEYDAEYETVLYQDQDGTDIRQLVIDEAILAMPLIANHADEADCESRVPQLSVPQTEILQQEEVENPFAALKGLIKG